MGNRITKNFLFSHLLVLTLSSMSLITQAAHEADIALRTPDGTELVDINGQTYRRRTINIADLWETSISTLEGHRISCINHLEQISTHNEFKSVKHGHISWLEVEEPFRTKKLGTAKYLVNYTHDFYRKKKVPFVNLLASPENLVPEDLLLTPAQRMERLVNYYKALGYEQVGEQNENRGTHMICYLSQNPESAELAESQAQSIVSAQQHQVTQL